MRALKFLEVRYYLQIAVVKYFAFNGYTNQYSRLAKIVNTLLEMQRNETKIPEYTKYDPAIYY